MATAEATATIGTADQTSHGEPSSDALGAALATGGVTAALTPTGSGMLDATGATLAAVATGEAGSATGWDTGAGATGSGALGPGGVQPRGGATCTMLPHFGQPRICPMAAMSRTFSFARQVVQVMEKSSTDQYRLKSPASCRVRFVLNLQSYLINRPPTSHSA